MEQNNCIVYRHIRPDKNEPFYIGIANNLSRPYDYGRNKIWEDIVTKNNGEYRVDILFDDLTFQQACEKEIEFIALYGRKNLGTGILSNLTDGGEGTVGIIVSEETRQKLRDINIGKIQSQECKEKHSIHTKSMWQNPEYRANNIAKNKAKTLSEEHKEANRKAQTGRVKSEETKRLIGLNGYFGNHSKDKEKCTWCDFEGNKGNLKQHLKICKLNPNFKEIEIIQCDRCLRKGQERPNFISRHFENCTYNKL